MSSLSSKIAFLCCCLTLFASCGTQDQSKEFPKDEDHTLKIYYFWTTAGDPNQHSSIKTGVEKAKDDQEVKRMFGERVKLVSMLDPGTADDAMALARELRRKPDTLAVIGHTYSGTTWSTLPIYADANVPVIVTNATSPYLFFKHGERDAPDLDLAAWNSERKDSTNGEQPSSSFVEPGTKQPLQRFTNAFRLIPADIPDQVGAVQLTIRQLNDEYHPQGNNGMPHVMLICDETTHSAAKVYSKPMCEYLERVKAHRDHAERALDYVVVSSRSIDLDHGDLWGLVTEIHAVRPDYIVLVGYTELARDLLQGLSERDSKENTQYTFIVTDGAFTDKLHKFVATTQSANFHGQRIPFRPAIDIFFTSPARPHQKPECNSTEPIVKENRTQPDATVCARCEDTSKVPATVPETAEAFAFDSVLILGKAVESCKERLDRSCVLQFLQKQQIIAGRCESYDLHQGERQYAQYYVYSEKQRRAGEQLSPSWCAQSEEDSLKPFPQACQERSRD